MVGKPFENIHSEVNLVSFAKRAFIAVGLYAAATMVHAAPVNGTGNVTPDVIYGSGNGNGSFTGQTANNIEVGLRAHVRYPAPLNVFNYDGDHTYYFVNGGNPTNRSVFNFDWSVNVDKSGTTGNKLSGFDYRLSFDTDASAAVNYTSFNPFNSSGYFDHSLGTNATGNGAGIEAADLAGLLANMLVNNVAQQSSNLGFGFSLDPDLAGIYDFRFEVLEKGTSNVLSSAEIQVQVPEPASLALAFSALGLLAVASRRRAKPA